MSLAVQTGTRAQVTPGAPYQVMVVDDSAVIRGIIARWLEEDPSIKVVNTAANGLMALRAVERMTIELVILDIEMPEMDGLTALPKLIEAVPDLKVIMASTLTARNADISLRALQMGAADYVPKPESNRAAASSIDFRRELVEKVKALGAALRRGRREALPDQVAAEPQHQSSKVRAPAPHPLAPAIPHGDDGKLHILPFNRKARPELIAIGSSTGGPQALFEFFTHFKTDVAVPVVITQHMPPTFTKILAEHLSRQSGRAASEAKDGEVLLPGHIYVAPGDHHFLVEQQGGVAVARITQDPPENFCRPSVDPMFRSIAKSFGDRVLCVMLTGMGHDGLMGSRDVIARGGTLIAQDEASSVVWGMPGAVAKAGLCHAVLPLQEIAPKVVGLLKGGAL